MKKFLGRSELYVFLCVLCACTGAYALSPAEISMNNLMQYTQDLKPGDVPMMVRPGVSGPSGVKGTNIANTTYVDSAVNAEAEIRADQDDEIRQVLAGVQASAFEFYLSTNKYTAGAFSYTPTNAQYGFCQQQTTNVVSFNFTYSATNTYGFVAFCTNAVYTEIPNGTAEFIDYANETVAGEITEKVELYAFITDGGQIEIGEDTLPQAVPTSPGMRTFSIPYRAYSNSLGFYIGIKKKCITKGAGSTVIQNVGDGYNTHLHLALPSTILADQFVKRSGENVEPGFLTTIGAAPKTNAQFYGNLNVTSTIISTTAVISGAENAEFNGIYSYGFTNEINGENIYTNLSGNWMTKSGSTINLFYPEYLEPEYFSTNNGELWYNISDYLTNGITMTGMPMYSVVPASIKKNTEEVATETLVNRKAEKTNTVSVGSLSVTGITTIVNGIFSGANAGAYAGTYYFAGVYSDGYDTIPFFTNASQKVAWNDAYYYMFSGNWVLADSVLSAAFIYDGTDWYDSNNEPVSGISIDVAPVYSYAPATIQKDGKEVAKQEELDSVSGRVSVVEEFGDHRTFGYEKRTNSVAMVSNLVSALSPEVVRSITSADINSAPSYDSRTLSLIAQLQPIKAGPISITTITNTTTWYTNVYTAWSAIQSYNTVLIWDDVATTNYLNQLNYCTNVNVIGVGGERGRRTIFIDSNLNTQNTNSHTTAASNSGPSNTVKNINFVHNINVTNAVAYGYCYTVNKYGIVDNCGFYTQGQYKHKYEAGGYKTLGATGPQAIGSTITNCTVGVFMTNNYQWVRLTAFHFASNDMRCVNTLFLGNYNYGYDLAGTGDMQFSGCKANIPYLYGTTIVSLQEALDRSIGIYSNSLLAFGTYDTNEVVNTGTTLPFNIFTHGNKGHVFVYGGSCTGLYANLNGVYTKDGSGYSLVESNMLFRVSSDGTNYHLLANTLTTNVWASVPLYRTTNAPSIIDDGLWIANTTTNSEISTNAPFAVEGWGEKLLIKMFRMMQQ